MAGRLQGSALCLPGAVWPSGWAASGHGSGQTSGRPDRPTGGPNAGQGLDGSRAVRCGSLGGFGRVNGRHLVPASGSQEDDQTGRQWATGWMPGNSRAAHYVAPGGSRGGIIGVAYVWQWPGGSSLRPQTLMGEFFSQSRGRAVLRHHPRNFFRPGVGGP